MKNLLEIQERLKTERPLTSNEILTFAPENLSEANLLNELIKTLKDEIKTNYLKQINCIVK